MPRKRATSNQNNALSKDGRTRQWTFIAYPDSAPENWRSILDDERIPWIESPLHEGEMNPDNETEKKSHWHILLLFEGKKNYENVIKITQRLNATIPKPCNNAKGLVRYMCHMDNPEKKQYSPTDIIGHCGADPSQYLKVSGAARYVLIGDMLDWVDSNDCNELVELVRHAKVEHFDDWFPLLCDNSAYILGEFIKSRRLSQHPEKRRPQNDN